MGVQQSSLGVVALAIAIGSALACGAILKPQDSVTRCDNPDDCDPTGDNRYVPVCKYDDEHMLDSSKYSKICVADIKRSVPCDPADLVQTPTHPIMIAAGKSACTELSCDPANNGKLGCPTADGSCTEGTPMDFAGFKFCGDEGVIPGFGLPDELELKHISDMYCRSYFCDEDFVCGANGKCTRCEGDDFLDGGCGTVYVDGAPAPVYVFGKDLTFACAGADVEIDDAVFGDVCTDA